MRRAGDALRITAELVDIGTSRPLWSDKYHGTMADIFALQERLSRQIVSALAIAVSPEESRALQSTLSDVQVYECYLRARQEMWQLTPDAVDHAIRLLERGIALGGEHPLLVSTLGLFRDLLKRMRRHSAALRVQAGRVRVTLVSAGRGDARSPHP